MNRTWSDDAPIKVLHIIVHLSAGGAELMMKRLIMAQSERRDIEHRVISLRGLGSVGPDLSARGIRVDALGLDAPWQFPSRCVRLFRHIRTWRPDVVQTWMYHADLIGGIAARISGVRAIAWNVRIAEISPRFGVSRTTGWIMRACALLSRVLPQRIVYVANSARKVHERAGYDPRKSITIHNGYVLDDQAPPANDLRAELGLPNETVLIASAGRNNAQKNQPGFIAACARLASSHPEAHFVMFGQGVLLEDRTLAAAVAATGYASRFHLLGERRDFTALLHQINLFCLHSLSEGFPNVVAEAMAAAIPCVVTDVGDAALLVGDTGWVVPPADDARLAAAMQEALSLDGTRLSYYGKRARHRIESNYSMPVISDVYFHLYREMSGRNSRSGG